MPNASPPWCLDDTLFSNRARRPDAEWLCRLRSKPVPRILSHVEQGGLLVDTICSKPALFTAAAAAIDEVADLAHIVRARVRHVHTLKAPPGYDISHSEPHWHDRIFVSIPERSDRVGALRLAESVIHEAMHLHLTVFEKNSPLVRDLKGEHYSPWRQSLRSYSGVIHGLFVFACLREYFIRLPSKRDADADADCHIRQRLRDIDAEIAQIDISCLSAGLAAAGVALAASLLERRSPPQ
jgi:HEXXH motif-containing protein